MIDRQRETATHIYSWHLQVADGTWWWCASLQAPDVNEAVFMSRVSRQRAMAYALEDAARQLHNYNPTTRVD